MSLAIDDQTDLRDALKGVALRHREIEDEPLQLALIYRADGDSANLSLFEVHDNFGRNEVDEDRQFFEFGFGPATSLPLADIQKVRLILTNPVELRVALDEGWPSALEVRDAVRRGDFEALFADEVGTALLELLR